ncbi:gluconokinase [Halomonas sp. RA08-2]|uniref:gluconokinase n=1 Tax=Halomonas sp. RA08-2 TaxID=3440842 RepID=UPI003EEDFB4E
MPEWMTPPKVVVMGVSGCGKSLIGARLARELDIAFFDADDFHSAANVQKMAEGIPLTDADRADWLEALAGLLAREPALVLACSALKRRYREQLRQAVPALRFLYLEGDFATIRGRLAGRHDHYFKGDDMLRSQFAQLEPPGVDEAVAVSIDQPPVRVLQRCVDALSAPGVYDGHRQ